jgi:hypothetical protein
MEAASYFREKAEQCRRMVVAILTRNDPTAASLNALAVEFDAAAAVIDARTAAAQVIGYGDDVPPEAAPPLTQPNEETCVKLSRMAASLALFRGRISTRAGPALA